MLKPLKFAGRIWDQAGMLVVFALLFAVCCAKVDSFGTWMNMVSLGLAVSTIGIVACTMLFCLASGDFDLSIGSVVACSGVVAAVVINKSESVGMGIGAGIAIGGLVGLFNGIVIAKLKINALIATLATMQIVRGLGYLICDGKSVGVYQEGFFKLGNSAPLQILLPAFEKIGIHPNSEGAWFERYIANFLEIPAPIWITLICFMVFGFVLSRTTFGRNTLAIGGNKEAARLAGIPVDRAKIIIFTAQGLMAGFAGVVLASRMTSGQPMASLGFELEVISACVLGGVSLTGGVGSMGCVVAGVLIMGTVQNVLNLTNVEPFWQYVARGGILLGAVLFDRFKQRKTME